MRLTKLEMYGFKSFARKTEIVFDDGITAIIGPNGSGKSNIADAVRWVLGEQSAKALRGEKMEDVIFNGTEAKKPLSYGEVSLTFDNYDHELATDFNEVCVTRRIYRSGESEYFINRSSCRRKDIAELFRDTGVGREGYSIIGQGRVEQILSAKSADRRSASPSPVFSPRSRAPSCSTSRSPRSTAISSGTSSWSFRSCSRTSADRFSGSATISASAAATAAACALWSRAARAR